MLSYAKKAFVAGALACISVLLGFNYPGWVDGSESFDWRSVAAAVIAAFVTGVATFYAQNQIPEDA